MSYKDIFKNSFLNGYESSKIDTKTIIICTLITAVIGMFIFMMYRIVTRKTFYNKTFNISIPAMAIITAAIILTIQSNIVLSLGMVGALSIVRFRTAVKDPLDLVFLYWSISVGIICGAGLAFIAVIVSILMAVVVVLLQKYPDKKLSKMLIINCSDLEAADSIMSIVKKYSKACKIKSRNLTKNSLDMIVEIKTVSDTELSKELLAVEGITSVSILTHDGEVTV